MRKTRRKMFSALMNRKAKCKFTSSCSLYSNTSFTCTHTGGTYCGKYRKLNSSTVPQNARVIEVSQ